MKITALLFFILTSFNLYAQQLPEKFDGFELIIKTKDYKTYQGQIIYEYENGYRLKQNDGEEISILKDFISYIRYDVEGAILKSIEDDSIKLKINVAGNTYLGKFILNQKSTVIFRTYEDTITTRKDAINRIEYYGYGALKKDEFSPSASALQTSSKETVGFDNYLYTPLYVASYQHLAPDEYIASYTNQFFFLNSVDFNFNENLGLSVGTIPLAFFGGVLPLWLYPRVSFPIKRDVITVGFSGLFAFGVEPGFGTFGGISAMASEITFGDRNNNLTAGIGIDFNGFSDQPIYKLSGMVRMGERFYLVTDNIRYDEIFIGILAGKSTLKKLNINYGFIIAGDLDFLFPLPYAGLTVPFR